MCASAKQNIYNTHHFSSSAAVRTRHMESDSVPRISQRSGGKRSNSFFTRCAVFGLSAVWIFVSLPILVIVMVIVVVFWFTHRLNVCCFHILGACPEFLTTTELLWLHSSRGAPSTIQCLIQLDDCVTLTSIRDIISSRILNLTQHRGMESYQRLKKRLVQNWISCTWCVDNDFSVEKHVTEVVGRFKSEVDVASHVAQMSCKDLEFDRPLWNVQVLHCSWGNGTYLLVRVHPCFADGNALIELLCQSLSDNVIPFKQPGERQSSHPVLSLISGVLFGPILLAYFKLSNQCNYSADVFPGLVPSGQNSVAWSRPINFPKILQSKAVANCAVSDFILCAVAGTVRSLLLPSNPYPNQILADLLYNLESCSNACSIACTTQLPWNTQYAKLPVQLRLSTEGIIPRLWDTLHDTRTLRQYCAKPISSGVLQILMLILPSRFAAMWLSRTLGGGKCIVSNLAGPQSPLSISGANVCSVVNWFPPGKNALLSLSSLSYNNELRVGVTVDNGLGVMAAPLAEEFATQMETMVAFLAHRQILRKHRRKRDEDFEDLDEFDDYPDSDQDATFEDDICQPCWCQRDSVILQDEGEQPHTRHCHALKIMTSSADAQSPFRSGSEKLFAKTLSKKDTAQRHLPEEGVTVHAFEDSICSVQTVKELDNGEVSVITGDPKPSSSRRESNGMTVITSVAVSVFDIQQPFEFSPCVERRKSNTVTADV